MQIVSTVLVLVGIVVGVLGLIGVALGRVPLLKLKGRGLAAGVLVGGLAVMIGGGLLAPKRSVTVTVSPANSTIRIDGQTYTGTTGPLALVGDSYVVEASASNHHPLKQTLNTAERQTFALTLTPFSAEELATVRRQAEAKPEQERQAQLSQEKAKEAAAAAERARVAQEQRSQQEAAANAAKAQAAAQAAAELEARKISIGFFLVKCRDVVRGQLKSPSTAKFPGSLESNEQARETEDGERVWAGYVDSQNGFGATVRTAFICTYSPATQEFVANLQ